MLGPPSVTPADAMMVSNVAVAVTVIVEAWPRQMQDDPRQSVAIRKYRIVMDYCAGRLERQRKIELGPAKVHRRLDVLNDFAFASYDAADYVVFFAGALEQSFRLFEFIGGDDCDQSDAHVEGAEHLFFFHVAEFL